MFHYLQMVIATTALFSYQIEMSSLWYITNHSISYVYVLWFNFILGLNFIFLCFGV